MNLLFVWVGRPFPDENKFYIDRAFELYPEANHFCITDRTDLPFDNLIIVPKKEIAEKIKVKYNVGVSKARLFSEYARWTFLGENAYTLYYDVDLYFKSRILVTDKTGYYKYDEFVLWSGSDPEAFHQAVLKRRASTLLVGCIDLLPKDSVNLEPYCIHKYKPVERNKHGINI